MAKIKTLQQSFTSGELDPTLFGRTDNDIYPSGADKLRNVYVRPQGGVFRREGLEYIDETTSSAEGRLVPFEFNTEQTYVLSFTAGEFKVYRTDVNGVQATVTSSPISSLSADMIKEMDWTQSADTLILVHPDIQPIQITRTSHTAWTATTITFTDIPAYSYTGISTSSPAGQVQPDVTTGAVILTGISTTFTSSYVGQYINMPSGGRIFVEKFNSTTELEGSITVELRNTDNTSDWELETGYEDVMSGSRGWVRSVTFFKGRLWLGGVGERPQTVIASNIDDFFNLREGSGFADQALNFTLDDNQVNQIEKIFAGRGLQIFTTGGEYVIGSNSSEPITPESLAGVLSKETLHGSGSLDNTVVKKPRPLSVDGATIFIERGGATVRQFIFNDAEASFNAGIISILSSHLIDTPVAMDVKRSTPSNKSDYVYVVNSDGTCAVLNTLREQQLLAWTLFETEGSFEDVVVSGRLVYFIVNRTINGSTVRYIEKLNADCKTDSSLVQTNVTPTVNWSGLDHLEGETIKLRGDDFILDDETVSSGAIVSSSSVSELEAGINFSARVKSLPLELVIQGQSFSGEWKNIIFANINLYESRNINVIIGGNTNKPPFRQFGSGVLDQTIDLFTGWKKVFGNGISRDVQVEITQDEPLELNVLSIHYGVRV